MNFAIFFLRDNLAKSFFFFFFDKLPKFTIFLCNWLTGILVFLEEVVLQNYFFLQSFVKISDIFPCRLTKFAIFWRNVFFCDRCSNSVIFCGRLANFVVLPPTPETQLTNFKIFFSRLFEEFHNFFPKRPFDEFLDLILAIIWQISLFFHWDYLKKLFISNPIPEFCLLVNFTIYSPEIVLANFIIFFSYDQLLRFVIFFAIDWQNSWFFFFP